MPTEREVKRESAEEVRRAKEQLREARLNASDARLRLKLVKNDAKRRRLRAHTHKHSDPSHHVDTCGLACRLGLRHHPHRDAMQGSA